VVRKTAYQCPTGVTTERTQGLLDYVFPTMTQANESTWNMESASEVHPDT